MTPYPHEVFFRPPVNRAFASHGEAIGDAFSPNLAAENCSTLAGFAQAYFPATRMTSFRCGSRMVMTNVSLWSFSGDDDMANLPVMLMPKKYAK